MILSFHPCLAADYQIILGDRSLGGREYALISEAEVILLPQTCSPGFYRACADSSAMLFPDYEVRFTHPGKVGQSRLFKEIGCRHPVTCVWPGLEAWENRHREKGLPHKLPFFLKTNTAHEGEGVFLIKDPRSLESALKRIRLEEETGSRCFLSQELIPSGGNTLRVVIMGRRMLSYWKRPEKEGQIISSIGRNGRVDKEWREDLQELGKEESRNIASMTGINLAALDFVFPLNEPAPQPHILEINYYFGRRGLGGSERFYRRLYDAVRDWLESRGIDPRPLSLV